MTRWRKPPDDEMRGGMIEPPDTYADWHGNDEQVSAEETVILRSMTETQIRDAGLRIDLPTEAASPDPQGIAYTDGTTLEERLDRRYEERRGGAR